MDTEAPLTTEDSLHQVRAKLFHTALFFSAMLALLPIDPAVLCVLWNWFAIKVGFHSLTYGYAFGLYLLLRFIISPGLPITIGRENGKKWPGNPKDLWMPMANAYTGRIITLGAGAVIHLLLSHG